MTTVALFTRAWIEIKSFQPILGVAMVALFTRAWIEILSFVTMYNLAFVALFTRAWIEIVGWYAIDESDTGRPLHEGVD